jgi:hypothetical protein
VSQSGAGFGAPRHFDDPVFHPLYEALQGWKKPVFLMTGPTTPDSPTTIPTQSDVWRGISLYCQSSFITGHGRA